MDVHAALDEVKIAIDGISTFPEEAEKPVIQSNRTHSSNIVRYGVSVLRESSPASKRNTAL